MQSRKLCRTYVMNVGTFSFAVDPLYSISRIEQTGRKLPYKLFTSVYFIVVHTRTSRGVLVGFHVIFFVFSR